MVVGVLILALVILFGSGPSPNAGTQFPDDGTSHTQEGTSCRTAPASCEVSGNAYSSVPGTSGPHWGTPSNWGVYSTPQNESQLIHNLEHGGIVVWYDPERLDADGIDALSSYVTTQVASGLSGRYKLILSPWAGAEPLPAPVVATAWRYTLSLETADTDAIDAFARARYGRSPEPNGGPAPPG